MHRKLPRDADDLDPQTSLLYSMEALLPDKGRDLPRLADVETMLQTIFDDPWFRRRLRAVTGFCVHGGRGFRGWAVGWRDKKGNCHIALPRNARRELYVLHELSHGLEPHAGHGGDFVATYLELVRRYLGEQVWRELYDLCRLWGVRHRRPRRQMDAFAGMFSHPSWIDPEPTPRKW